MNSYVLLLLIVTSLYSSIQCRSNNGKRRGNNKSQDINKNVDKFLREISKGYYKLEQKMESYCLANKNEGISETYSYDAYTLTFKEFRGDKIDVKIKNRVLVAIGKETKGFAFRRQSFYGAKTLPDIVNLKRGSWASKDNELTVIFPYKIRFNEPFAPGCKIYSAGKTISVPQSKHEGYSLDKNVEVKRDNDSLVAFN